MPGWDPGHGDVSDLFQTVSDLLFAMRKHLTQLPVTNQTIQPVVVVVLVVVVVAVVAVVLGIVVVVLVVDVVVVLVKVLVVVVVVAVVVVGVAVMMASRKRFPSRYGSRPGCGRTGPGREAR